MTQRKPHSARTLTTASWWALIMTVIPAVLFSCAKMGSPDGGWYDEQPPRVVSSTPGEGAIGVTTQKVIINFDEYIKLADPQQKVVISPAQKETPEIRASGKRIIVDLKDSLKPNTTYTIDFSDAISDNNESNPMGNYTYSFSTGTKIDTFEVAGYVLSADNLEPVKDILVGLTAPDSTLSRVSRTNGSGQFVIKGVAPGQYNILALKDADGDLRYSQKSEMVAFTTDSLTPSAFPDIRQDTIWRDSLRIANILRTGYTHFMPDNITLRAFLEEQTDRYFLKAERKQPDRIDLFFSYGHEALPLLEGLNYSSENAFVIEASEKRDTIQYWLRDSLLINQDTLTTALSYYVTDSTGVLTLTTDTMDIVSKTGYEKRQKQKENEMEKWRKEQEKKKKRGEPYDSIPQPQALKLTISPRGTLEPEQHITITTQTPLMSCDTTAFHITELIDSVETPVDFVFRQTALRTFTIEAQWKYKQEYRLTVDSAAMTDIYGVLSSPIDMSYKVRPEEEYGSIIADITFTDDTTAIIIQLLNQQDKMVREASPEKGLATFRNLKPGKYYLRAIVDRNDNGQWDTGNYLLAEQPEEVYYCPEPVECKAKWKIKRQWNLTLTPLYRQKPPEITKQKADRQRQQQRNRNAERARKLGKEYIEKNVY